MPYYNITIWLKDLSVQESVRLLKVKDIDRAWKWYHDKAKEYYCDSLIPFRMVALSKLDPYVKGWIKVHRNLNIPPAWVKEDYEA